MASIACGSQVLEHTVGNQGIDEAGQSVNVARSELLSSESNNPDATRLAFNWAMSICNEALVSPKGICELSL
jgi:hypothetical protein